MKPEDLNVVFLQATPALREKISSYIHASLLSALNLYQEASGKQYNSSKEKAAQVAVAAARVATITELLSKFFVACAIAHVGDDEHAQMAAMAALGPVEALHERRLAQWVEEANASLN